MDKVDPRLGFLGVRPGTTESRSKKKDEVARSKSFGRVLHQEKERLEETEGFPRMEPGTDPEAAVETLLDDVHTAGAELLKHPNPDRILDYRKKISAFLKLIVSDSFQLTEKFSWKKKNQTKIKHVLLQRVNEKLDKLAAYVLQTQKDQLEILRRVNELQGLLVDLIS